MLNKIHLFEIVHTRRSDIIDVIFVTRRHVGGILLNVNENCVSKNAAI